jgi:NADH dehydrogenase [ubiquinone] 1 alpha subcomplex assembly factor 7
MSYDPDLRRDTPLALKLKARIRREGPITVAQYMQACLQDEEFGYYRTQRAIGADGDFITAPEISQVFGELIGLWCAAVWQSMGRPTAFNLVEIGPGRGTLLQDVLRATRLVPAFQLAATVTLIEPNRALEAQQRAILGDLAVRISWVPSIAEFHAREVAQLGVAGQWDVPTLVLGNEVLDTAIIEQLVRCDGRWLLRRIALDAQGTLAFLDGGLGPDFASKGLFKNRVLDQRFPNISEGEFVEIAHFGEFGRMVGGRKSYAGLFIDYGHTVSEAGETLQAVRHHRHEHALTAPGEADLSTAVDFSQFVAEITSRERENELVVDGPVPQAEFLGSLGILQRASKLMAANPGKAGEIEAGVARLMAPNGMGTRFKAIGLRSRGLPPLPGFPTL